MDTAIYRVRNAPLPRSLNVSPKSRDRWLIAHDTAQRLMAMSYEYAVRKVQRFDPEYRAMVMLRLAAQHGRPSEIAGS
jgi:hypothetical protein